MLRVIQGQGSSARTREPELDAALLARCSSGDPEAFRAFVEHYQVMVFALLSRLAGRGPHVEDLAQETFVRAHRALPGFDAAGSARLSTWLLTIGTRVVIDVRRRSGRSDAHVRELLQSAPAPGPASPEQLCGRAELMSAIQRAAAELPEDQRIAFVLSEFHDFGLAEIAEALGIPESTVKTRLFRARRKLAHALSPYKEGL
jgi:RNA polymerase sigma-70 factor (ECF subfamily)